MHMTTDSPIREPLALRGCAPLLMLGLLLCGGCPGKPEAAETSPPSDAPSAPAERPPNPKAGQVDLHPELRAYVARLVEGGFDSIPAERKKRLQRLARFVEDKRAASKSADLTYICTHNSRRSHMSQLWAATAAAWYGIDGVTTYSGGTETTAFNPRAVASLERAGFAIENPGGENPRYRVTYGPEGPVMECFSKKYDDPFNPATGFAAVLTCSRADESCPVVRGADLRVGIPYDDPKVADGTPEESARYDERCRQIATEMLYLFSQVDV
jgi:arsenate reductase